jgi:hypothetical protein
LFKYIYIPDEGDEIVVDIIKSLKTKSDANNLFAQIFEILNDDSEKDVHKVRKAFYLAEEILKSFKGLKIIETVVGKNKEQFEEYIIKADEDSEINSTPEFQESN